MGKKGTLKYTLQCSYMGRSGAEGLNKLLSNIPNIILCLKNQYPILNNISDYL